MLGLVEREADTLNQIETAMITTSAKDNSSVDASAFDGSVTLIGGAGRDILRGEVGNDKAIGGQGKTGSPRNGNSIADLGDVITAEVTDETFAILFAFE